MAQEYTSLNAVFHLLLFRYVLFFFFIDFTKGLFTPGMPSSPLSFLWTKIHCIFFGLVRFLFKFTNEFQDLKTNQVCAAIVQWLGGATWLKNTGQETILDSCIRCAHQKLFHPVKSKIKTIRGFGLMRILWRDVCCFVTIRTSCKKATKES